MRIAILGYGKMGKAIEEIAIERGHTISLKINSQNPIEKADFSTTDVAIEFSIPDLAEKHMKTCLQNNVPVVVGTTGWNDLLPEITSLVKEKNASLLHASNFSIGVNLFFKLNEQLAQLMNKQSEYKADIEEIHHLQKLDAPSGTAITLAEGIIENTDKLNAWKLKEDNLDSLTLPINAIREPNVPGTHSINYTSEIDTITISHEAHSRKGFAQGAVVAAEWITERKGVYTMRDLLNI